MYIERSRDRERGMLACNSCCKAGSSAKRRHPLERNDTCAARHNNTKQITPIPQSLKCLVLRK